MANKDDIIYCDPPYIGRNTAYYNNWTEKDELDLYNLLYKFNGKFILSTWYKNKYRENEFIKKLWSNFNIITREHFYYVGGKEVNRNSMIEALIMNFEPTKINKVENEQLLSFEF